MSQKEKQTEFENAGEEEQLSLAKVLIIYVTENKQWWLIPILLVLGLVGRLVVLGLTGAATFMYALF